MRHLLNIEFAKIKSYKVFWIIILIYAAVVPLVFVSICKFLAGIIPPPIGPTYEAYLSFPDVWPYVTWTASWFNFLLGILIIILTINEISFKTQRQNVIDGLSKRDMIISKVYLMLVLSFFVTLYTFILGLICGMIYSDPANAFENIEYIGIYFIQTMGYFSFAFFFAILIRKSALAIILFLVIFIIRYFLEAMIGAVGSELFPINVIGDLSPFPFFEAILQNQIESQPGFEAPFRLEVWQRVCLAVVYIAAFLGIGYFVVKKRDL